MPKFWMSFIFIVCALLILRMSLFFLYRPVLYDGQHVSFSTTLLSEPTLSGNSFGVTVSYGNMFGSLPIRVYFNPALNLHYGETVKITGNLKKRLIKNNTLFFLSNPKIEAKSQNSNFVLSLANNFRQKTKVVYEQVLPQSQASLLLGIVLGIRGNFPAEYLRQLQTVGVVHVIAASGMNVSMVGGFLFGLLGRFFKRRLSLILCIIGICFYMLLAGLQPSIVRAGIMIIFVFMSQIFGRQYIPFYGLCIAIVSMIFFTPSLVFDIGFQLSVLSTVGILFIKPLIPKTAVLEDIATTTSAQLATLPILMANFGQYGITSVIVNALVLWTIPPLMILGGIGACINFIPFVSYVFIFLAQPLLWFFESVILIFAKLDLSIKSNALPFSIIAGYYLLLGSTLWYMWQKKVDKQMLPIN